MLRTTRSPIDSRALPPAKGARKRRELLLVLLLLSPAALITHPAGAQDFEVSVAVSGKKGKQKKADRDIKKGICRAVLDHLAGSLEGTELPSKCNEKAKGASYMIKADAMFDSPPPVLNLLLELRNLKDDSIIKQKAHTIDIVKGMKEYEDLLYHETSKAMKEVLPTDWKPHIVKEAVLAGQEESPGEEAVEGAEELPFVDEPREGDEAEVEAEAAKEPAVQPEPEKGPGASHGILLAVSPKKAIVTLDGKKLGKAPLGLITGVSPGEHKVTVEKEGYGKLTTRFQVPDSDKDLALRHDVILKGRERRKRGSVAGKWWLWTIIGVVVLGGGAATTAGVLLTREKTDAIPFPGY